MKTLILHATKHGATRKIAKLIAQEIPDSVVKDVEESDPHLPSYDCVILGSSLMAGQIRKPLKNYIAKHQSELLTKKLGLFLSGLAEEEEEKYFNHNFPPEILQAAATKHILGGIYDPQQCNALEKVVMRIVTKSNSYISTVKSDKIAAFVHELNQ